MPVDERTRQQVGLRPTYARTIKDGQYMSKGAQPDLLQNVCSGNEPGARRETFPTHSCFYHVGALYDGTP